MISETHPLLDAVCVRDRVPPMMRRRPMPTALRIAAAAAGLFAVKNQCFTGNVFGTSSSSHSGKHFQRKAAAASTLEAPPTTTQSQQDMWSQASESYLSVLRQLADEGLPNEAEDALYEMIDAGGKLTPSHFAAVIASCAREGDTERAERWLFRMKALQVLPDVDVFNALMKVAAEAGSPKIVGEWLEESYRAGIDPDIMSFKHMMRALRVASDTGNAESWFERLMDSGIRPDITCVNELIGLFAENNNLAKVDEWLAIAEQTLGLVPDVETYNLVLKAYTDSGNIKAAEKLLMVMQDRDVQANAESYIVLIGDGKSVRDQSVIEEWAGRLLKEDLELDSNAFTSVIGAWASVGEAKEAEAWYKRMEEAGLETAEALALLVDTLVLSDRGKGEEEAERWIRKFQTSGKELTPSVYAARASADVHQGDFEQVEARMQQMERNGLEMNEDCLTVILLAYANAAPQQPQLAEQMFKQQMLRGKLTATKEVLEALRAAVGGARCLSLRRELQITTSKTEQAYVPSKSKRPPRRVWSQFKKPEPPKSSLKWE